MIDKKVLKILACPFCKGDIDLKEEKILCIRCGLKFTIKNDIPIMLLEEREKQDYITQGR